MANTYKTVINKAIQGINTLQKNLASIGATGISAPTVDTNGNVTGALSLDTLVAADAVTKNAVISLTGTATGAISASDITVTPTISVSKSGTTNSGVELTGNSNISFQTDKPTDKYFVAISRSASGSNSTTASGTITVGTISKSVSQSGYINSTKGTVDVSKISAGGVTSKTVKATISGGSGTSYLVLPSATATNGTGTATLSKSGTTNKDYEITGNENIKLVSTAETGKYFISIGSSGTGTASVGEGYTRGLTPSVTISGSTKVSIPAGSCTVAGGGLTKGTASGGGLSQGTASGGGLTSGDGSVGGTNITYSTTDASGIAVTGSGSVTREAFSQTVTRAAFSQTVSRAAITDTHTAGYIPAKSATTTIAAASSTVTLDSSSSTVSLASASKSSNTATKYVTGFTINSGKTLTTIVNAGTISSLTNYITASDTTTNGTININGGNVSNGVQIVGKQSTVDAVTVSDSTGKLITGTLSASAGLSGSNVTLSTTNTSGISVVSSASGAGSKDGWITTSTKASATSTRYIDAITVPTGKTLNKLISVGTTNIYNNATTPAKIASIANSVITVGSTAVTDSSGNLVKGKATITASKSSIGANLTTKAPDSGETDIITETDAYELRDSKDTTSSNKYYIKTSISGTETSTLSKSVTSGYITASDVTFSPTSVGVTTKTKYIAIPKSSLSLSGGKLSLGTASKGSVSLSTNSSNSNISVSASSSKPSSGYYVQITGSASASSVNVSRADISASSSAGYSKGSTSSITTTTDNPNSISVSLTPNSSSSYFKVASGVLTSALASSITNESSYSEYTNSGKDSSGNTTGTVGAIPTDGYLYISSGYYPNIKISLGTLIPDDTSLTNAGSAHILKDYEAYDSDGKKLVGTIATISPSSTYYTTTNTGFGVLNVGYNSTVRYIIKGVHSATAAATASATNATLETTNNSGIVFTASASATSTISTAGWLDKGTATGSNSATKYLKEITVASGKTLAKVTNAGTITSLVNSGTTTATNSGTLNITSNTDTVKYINWKLCNNTTDESLDIYF